MSDIRRLSSRSSGWKVCDNTEHTSVKNSWTIKRIKKYQSLCARANFFAVDRIDLQFGAKKCCRSMSRPTVRDWSILKRMRRFLAGCPRLVDEHKFQEEQKMLTSYSNANWASNASDRRSTKFSCTGAITSRAGEMCNCSLRYLRPSPNVCFGICDQRLGTIAEDGRVQRGQRTLGVSSPKPAKAQTRGLQFHMHAEPERAEGCATFEEAGKRQSFGNLHQR